MEDNKIFKPANYLKDTGIRYRAFVLFFQSEPIMLKDYLYIGNATNASCKEEMLKLGITAILNVSNTCQNHFSGDFRYKTIAVEDDGSTDLSKWFKVAIQFIGKFIPNVFKCILGLLKLSSYR